MSDYDLIIRGGRILDGTGGPEMTSDIAIRDGKIADVGKITANAHKVIDAEGALVTPGFVDIHTHYDGQATWSNRLSPSNHHGVTTAVMGNCGVGFAPVRPNDHDLLIELMEGVEDIPGAALHEGLSWQWESFPDYLDYLDQKRFDMDLGTQVPHAALRVFVMGERGARREIASTEDIAEMRRLTEEAIRAGALGFSSSRTLNHRSSKGDPTPSLTAAREELVGIGLGVKDAGRGVLEMISDFADLDAEFETIMAMVKESGAPMTISMAQGLNPHGWKKLYDKVEAANRSGLVVKGQVAPRAIGIMLGLNASLNPFMLHPSYREIVNLPLEDRVARLRDSGFRKKLLSESSAHTHERLKALVGQFEKMWVLGDPPNYEPEAEDSIAARAKRMGVTAEEMALDCLLEKDGHQFLYTPFANYANFNLDVCREFITAEHTVMGLGDGGAHVGTICDASFVTYLLTHWGRDRVRGEKLALPLLVKAQSRDTARAVGLLDRGVIAPGMKADINIIDFERLKINAPKMIYDLPAGGGRLDQTTEGFLATIVSGKITYENGEATGDLPGRLVRGQKH
ncbi:MAG: amidohydrolase family protein, partial [Gammaproteobacteria bacterium]|nr:amidohydrolase family protein [Gammaproteobacteria bacterium]